MSDDDIEVMYSAAEIAARVSQLAEEIVAKLGPEFVVVAVLKGSFIFTADLIRAMYHCGARPEIDFMTLSSYGTGQESTGNVETLLRGFQMAPGEVGLVDARFELESPDHGRITHLRCPAHERCG